MLVHGISFSLQEKSGNRMPFTQGWLNSASADKGYRYVFHSLTSLPLMYNCQGRSTFSGIAGSGRCVMCNAPFCCSTQTRSVSCRVIFTLLRPSPVASRVKVKPVRRFSSETMMSGWFSRSHVSRGTMIRSISSAKSVIVTASWKWYSNDSELASVETRFPD
ncbi:Hypothetical Protein PANA_3411 [Pantoea ananatis LMG 20103]|uniref:Uncharacterized protein n=1 Tax=Pantoea ananatis (strain LMG 20103) TaxID=706191 RepID=D4GNM3_PANAM|nr:Hypothetical Protein PANA_3411 [Pantoea ananatis LMG 20103]